MCSRVGEGRGSGGGGVAVVREGIGVRVCGVLPQFLCCLCLLQVTSGSGPVAGQGNEAEREVEEAIGIQRIPGKGLGTVSRGGM